MTDHIDFERLARYVSGESGATERAEIERWAAATAANKAMLDSVRRRWSAASEGTSWNVDAAWGRLLPRLREVQPERGLPKLSPGNGESSIWRRWTTIVPLAAAAALLVAVALRFGPQTDTESGTSATLAAETMRTGIGEQRTIDLSDGSQVLLGAASTLRLAEDFGAASREVFLEGQAFLRVRHDAARPFVVNAGGTRAIDLGTAFEVRAYPSEGVRVAVTEGVVEVRREGSAADSAVLEPGDIAEVPESGEAVVRRQQNVERLLGWTRGELMFDDSPLGEIGRELERWFDVRVRFEDEALERLRLSMSLRIGESLDVILDLIERSLSSRGVRAERNGNVVTIRSGPPTTRSALPPSPSRVEAGA